MHRKKGSSNILLRENSQRNRYISLQEYAMLFNGLLNTRLIQVVVYIVHEMLCLLCEPNVFVLM